MFRGTLVTLAAVASIECEDKCQIEVGHGNEGMKTSGNEYVFKNLGAGGGWFSDRSHQGGRIKGALLGLPITFNVFNNIPTVKDQTES